MTDTGRTVWADGLWADDFWAAGLWAADEPVTVPDVVGQSQASGTVELEGAAFVVAVSTAYSSIVAAGDIISQNPTAGTEAASGSTVTITVSLGEAPAANESFSGGFEYAFERERARRKKERERLEELKAEAERIEDETTREIARFMRQQEAKDARRDELTRLQSLVDRFKANAETTNERIERAVQKAAEKQTQWALFALERELERAREEEEFVLIALRAALD